VDVRRLLRLSAVAALFACDNADPYDVCDHDPTPTWLRNEVKVYGVARVENEVHSMGGATATRDGFIVLVRRDGAFRQFRLTFEPPERIGIHRLEDVKGVALICPPKTDEGAFAGACVDWRGDPADPDRIPLEGTLEVLDVRVDLGAGVPDGPPKEPPWGWRMKTTNENVLVDVAAESRPTWFDPNRDCR
jgi:hypothetical protein